MKSVLKRKIAPLTLALVMIGAAVAAGATMASAAASYTRSYSYNCDVNPGKVFTQYNSGRPVSWERPASLDGLSR